MAYELPPEEKARLRKVENVLMIFFGGIILMAIFGVVYSRFRPLSRTRPGTIPKVAPQGNQNAPGAAPTSRS